MTIIDPVGDMFTRIRNGQMRSLTRIDVPASKFRLQILIKLIIVQITEISYINR